MHPFHDYLCQQLDDMLKKRGIVVFYDPRREFAAFFERELKQTRSEYHGLPRVLVKERPTFVARHEDSFFALRAAVEPIAALDKPDPLIVYLPGIDRDPHTSVLMELEKAGRTYKPSLRDLARKMLLKTGYSDVQIDALRVASANYDDIVSFLNQGEKGNSASVLRTIFDGAQSEALMSRWLAEDDKDTTIVEKDAAIELFKLMESRLGLSVPEDTTVAGTRDKLLRYVLVGEFRSDLECEPPPSVAMVPEPPSKEHVERIRDVAERLRRERADRYIDLLGNKVEAELGVAFFIAAYSVLRKSPPQPGLLVLGDMSVQGNVKAARSLTEPLQVAMDNGAKRALVPIENKRQFLEVNPEVLEHVDPLFYGDLRQAAFKALGLN